MELEEPLNPWTERARRLRLAWTREQQAALAQALWHAPNDGMAVAMAPLMLGVAACGAELCSWCKMNFAHGLKRYARMRSNEKLA